MKEINLEIPKIKDMTELFFDLRVFEFLKNEIENVMTS